jgi:hypothetical protein
MQDGVPAGHVLKCNYRFGGLSLLLVKADGTKQPKPKAEKEGLGDYFKRMAANGQSA